MSAIRQTDPAYRRLLGISGMLFLSYLAIAMPLPAVPVYVVHRLGLNSAWAGLAVGVAFLSTILTRGYTGGFADRMGGKPCMLRGLLLYAIANLICLASVWPGLPVPASYAVLIELVPPQLRGTAVGGFAAFQDLAYGGTGPLAGLLADHVGYAPVFLVGGIAATLGLGMAISTHRVLRFSRRG